MKKAQSWLHQCRRPALRGHGQQGFGGHYVGISGGHTLGGVYYAPEETHLPEQVQPAVGGAIGAKAYGNPGMEQLGGGRNTLAAVGEGAVNNPHLTPGQDFDFLLAEEDAVWGGHGGGEQTLLFQPEEGALAAALDEVRYLAGVLVHMGLHRHTVLCRCLKHRPEQLFTDGGGGGNRINGL